jgi:hypothetical protein
LADHLHDRRVVAHAVEVIKPVKTKGGADGVALEETETVGEGFRSKPYGMVAFEDIAKDFADQPVLGDALDWRERGCRIEEPPAAKGKPAVADDPGQVAGRFTREAGRADIVVAQERIGPRPRVDDVTVPLRDQREWRGDAFGQALQAEARIVLDRAERWDCLAAETAGDRCIGEQDGIGEVDLVEADFKRPRRELGMNGIRDADRDVLQAQLSPLPGSRLAPGMTGISRHESTL